jgi:hypothetical protein
MLRNLQTPNFLLGLLTTVKVQFLSMPLLSHQISQSYLIYALKTTNEPNQNRNNCFLGTDEAEASPEEMQALAGPVIFSI